MRLAVYCSGNFIVTVPYGMNSHLVENFIIRKSKWIIDKLEYFKNFQDLFFAKGGKREFVKYKEQALALAKERVNYFNKKYRFEFNEITIKNQKTRWGSCSRKGNLNFNYKIAILPRRLSDYIIVHELCHLGEFNHSRKFWNLIAKAMPDYLELRDELKKSRIYL